MDIQNLVIAGHHISLIKVMKDYHSRHYIWEMSKVIIPAFITGVITFVAMRIIDNKNKKRWLNDGHVKRKTELEIEIRKFLLGIKDSPPDEYYELADRENDEPDSKIVSDFNNDFGTLYKHLAQEQQKDSINDESLFALMDEYVCYVPKIKTLFDDFKSMCADILKLEQENPDQLQDKANIYLCFQDVIERILKKIAVKKLK